jgi:DNA-binding PadR family transcriptional regulator
MTKVQTAKLAYHLGLLKSEDLIKFTYERRGKATSRYFITDLGRAMVKELRAEPLVTTTRKSGKEPAEMT